MSETKNNVNFQFYMSQLHFHWGWTVLLDVRRVADDHDSISDFFFSLCFIVYVLQEITLDEKV